MEKNDNKYKPYLIFVSFFVNLLVLVPSVYMIQIYDRVMATQNIGTMISITCGSNASFLFNLILLGKVLLSIWRKFIQINT